MWNLSKDRKAMASLDPSAWGYTVVMVIVVIILITALMGTLTTWLGYYAANETALGGVVQTIVPILISVAIILSVVVGLLSYRGRKGV